MSTQATLAGGNFIPRVFWLFGQWSGPVVTLLTKKPEGSGTGTRLGGRWLISSLHQPCSTLQEQQSWWGRRQGSPYPPPPTSFHNVLNLMHGQEKIRKNLFHFQDWICRENYHFDFYVGEKYMECLLVDFSDYNRWSIGAIWLFPMIDCEILTNSHHFSKKGVPVVWFL